MKRTIASIAVLALAATAANAADVYAPTSLKDRPIAVEPSNWTGFYFGANAGAGWSQLDSSLTLAGGGDSITLNHTNSASGVIGGGQMGYNYQTGAVLFGVEADFGVIGFSQTRDILSGSVGPYSGGFGTRFEGGFAADVTGRLGYASGSGLIYIKGGWAYLDATAGIHAALTPFDLSANNVSSSGFNGWTIGGGIEYALSPAWSIKGEYQHFDFGSFALHPIADAPDFVINNTLTVDTVKVGLNYHLGATYSALK